MLTQSGVHNVVGENEELQYGAWLRGETFRRNGHESNYYGLEKGGGTRRWETGAVVEKGLELLQARGSTKKDGKEHVPNLTTMEKCPLTRHENNADALKQQREILHENGMVRELVRKQVEKEGNLGEKVLDQGKDQVGLSEKMVWETATDHKETPKFEIVMAPSHETKNVEGGPVSSSADPGPIAMSYDTVKGWTAEPLGPQSRHWKRLAREAKPNSRPEEKSPTGLKREGPIPLQELDSNVYNQKRRKGEKQSNQNQTLDEKIPKDGGVAVAAVQHRRAK
nr:hypothetical protein CFP56_47566 [Quercus suber]